MLKSSLNSSVKLLSCAPLDDELLDELDELLDELELDELELLLDELELLPEELELLEELDDEVLPLLPPQAASSEAQSATVIEDVRLTNGLFIVAPGRNYFLRNV